MQNAGWNRSHIFIRVARLLTRMAQVLGGFVHKKERPYDPFEAKQLNWEVEQASRLWRYRF